MSEVIERDREMATAFCGRHKRIQYAFDDLSQMFAAARAEERAEFARLAQTEEMVEKVRQRVYHMVGWEHDEGTIEDILAALFHETGVSP